MAHTAHTITSLTPLLRTQAHTYLLTKPYALRSQPWLTTHLERLFGTEAMNEDVLLQLSRLLGYRIEVCRQATAYKDVVGAAYADCAGCNVEVEVERWVGGGEDEDGMEKEARRQRAVRRQGRILALQEVVDRIARAELFAKPPGKYEAANREAKGVIYLALVVLRWSEGGKGRVEEVVARLERVKHEICRPNVYHPKCMVGYGGPGAKGTMK